MLISLTPVLATHIGALLLDEAPRQWVAVLLVVIASVGVTRSARR